MRGPFTILMATMFAFSILAVGSASYAGPASAATIAATTTCSNGVDNTPGLGLICEITIENTITPTGGSAVVTVRECHGAAGDPEAACTTETVSLTAPVTAVNQCNDATNGGGGWLECSVNVTNRYVGLSPTITDATINQCVGSGGGITIGCDPFPATTTGATITQCNGSANGGTLVGLDCTASGTVSDAFDVTINQCNDSTNGGGARVICSASVDNVIAAPTPTPTPTGTSTATSTPAPTPSLGTTASPPGGGLTPPPTDAASLASPTRTTSPILLVVLALGVLAAAFVIATTKFGRRPA